MQEKIRLCMQKLQMPSIPGDAPYAFRHGNASWTHASTVIQVFRFLLSYYHHKKRSFEAFYQCTRVPES